MEATLSPPSGRGLNALLGDLSMPESVDATVCRLPLGKIAFNPYQPRKQFDGDELASLSASIKTHVSSNRSSCGPLLRLSTHRGRAQAPRREEAGWKRAGHVVHLKTNRFFEAALVRTSSAPT